MPRQRSKVLLLTAAALVVAIPALAQVAAPTPVPSNTVQSNEVTEPANSTAPAPIADRRQPPGGSDIDALVEMIDELPPPPPPVELPDHARRDPTIVGPVDPAALGLGPSIWGDASGAFLSGLLRRMDAPIASRWGQMALRNALIARVAAPRAVNPVDWVAERAWLLLRMGEADAARMLVAGVDVDNFTPKMFQVAMQSALANADPSALCPLEDGLGEVEGQALPLVEAMCAALAGEPESAAAQIDSARRRGRASGIDLVLAEKVVGAGTNTGRAVTVEWEPVERLNSWRFGLATATGMTFPDRLTNAAPPQLRAWQARAPLLTPLQRIDSARIATGLGVFSSQALLDLYSAIYDSTDPDDLPESDAWQVRLAFVGRDQEARLAAMRRLWSAADGRIQRKAAWALLSRAASLVPPSVELQEDAANLIASMLAGGRDREAARWAAAVRRFDDRAADQSWAMLATGVPDPRQVELTVGRVNAFIGRDDSRGRTRSAFLVAGLAGLGRLDLGAADRLNRRYGLGLDHRTRYTRMLDSAAARGQAGTVLVMSGTGLQSFGTETLSPAHLFHIVAALRKTNQDFMARMIAAEALAAT